MLNYSFPCSCSKYLCSFRFIIKQQWTIEEISILSNSSHLEWRAGLSDIILKRTHPRTIPARFGLIWFRGFRGEDLNVKVYDVRWTPSDGKSSHSLWPGELKKFWLFQVFYHYVLLIVAAAMFNGRTIKFIFESTYLAYIYGWLEANWFKYAQWFQKFFKKFIERNKEMTTTHLNHGQVGEQCINPWGNLYD
jgi:hypothetical protein